MQFFQQNEISWQHHMERFDFSLYGENPWPTVALNALGNNLLLSAILQLISSVEFVHFQTVVF